MKQKFFKNGNHKKEGNQTHNKIKIIIMDKQRC